MQDKDKLKTIVMEIERLIRQKENLNDQINILLSNAKESGLHKKIIQLLLKRRKRPKSEVEEEERLLAEYDHALTH
jgi:uncharacterized protein (UPF0335 family)